MKTVNALEGMYESVFEEFTFVGEKLIATSGKQHSLFHATSISV
jgi:hypothetical protein